MARIGRRCGAQRPRCVEVREAAESPAYVTGLLEGSRPLHMNLNKI